MVQDSSGYFQTFADSWTGVEVEGRLKGLPTLFLRKLGAPDPLRLPHVFLLPELIADTDQIEVAEFVVAASAAGVAVTVAVFPADYCALLPVVLTKAHIMLDIRLPEGIRLKPTDSVKVQWAPFDVAVATVETMHHATPVEYARDSVGR